MTITKPTNEYAVWLYLRDAHCAFQRKRKNIRLCTHKYTVNGAHSYIYCPLITEEYLTVKLEDTTVVAFKKKQGTRIPSQMWERIELTQTKEEGLNELKGHANKIALHPEFKKVLFARGEQFFDIAEELKQAPELEEDLLEDESDILEDSMDDIDDSILDEDFDDLDEDLLDEE